MHTLWTMERMEFVNAMKFPLCMIYFYYYLIIIISVIIIIIIIITIIFIIIIIIINPHLYEFSHLLINLFVYFRCKYIPLIIILVVGHFSVYLSFYSFTYLFRSTNVTGIGHCKGFPILR